MDGLLAEMPPRMLTEWRAHFLLRPWNAANTAALVAGGFKRPEWLEDMVCLAERRMDKAAKAATKGQTSARTFLYGDKTILGFTWP